jgi:HSP20 family protein
LSLLELPFWAGSGRQSQLSTGWTPALDLYQNNDNIVAVVELPGMRKEEIEISHQDGTLLISGERQDRTSPENGTTRTERCTGKFRRSIKLPTRVEVNKVNATYKDGILTVTLPKAEEAKPKQIQINLTGNRARKISGARLSSIRRSTWAKSARRSNKASSL